MHAIRLSPSLVERFLRAGDMCAALYENLPQYIRLYMCNQTLVFATIDIDLRFLHRERGKGSRSCSEEHKFVLKACSS